MPKVTANFTGNKKDLTSSLTIKAGGMQTIRAMIEM